MATDKLVDLDEAIADLVIWRKDATLTYKERLAVTDRLLKALQLKYKNSDEGKGGKFVKPKGDSS